MLGFKILQSQMPYTDRGLSNMPIASAGVRGNLRFGGRYMLHSSSLLLAVIVTLLVLIGCSTHSRGSKESRDLQQSRRDILSYMRQLRAQSLPDLSPINYLFGSYRSCAQNGSVRYTSGTSWTSLKRGSKNPEVLADAVRSLELEGWPVSPGSDANRRTIRKGTVVIELVGMAGRASIDGNAISQCFQVGDAARDFLKEPGDEFSK
jgi:hypothetical protein